ncbi:hypothetical protein F4861DRAFT_515227 [Xylaria intraflava]|nr:hypothetical protein F4861DRAFT_515227 [Xylaria intraflava]
MLGMYLSLANNLISRSGRSHKVQWLVIPTFVPGIVEMATSCKRSQLWGCPAIQSFELLMVDELLQRQYPSLAEVLITEHFGMLWTHKATTTYDFYPPYTGQGDFGRIRTTYLGKLRLRYSPAGLPRKRGLGIKRYAYWLGEADVKGLEIEGFVDTGFASVWPTGFPMSVNCKVRF